MNHTASLLHFYRKHLQEQLLPFWQKAVDEQEGGIFTGFDPTGEKLLRRDKFTWSQGRYLWIWARLAEMSKNGLIAGEFAQYERQASMAYCFLQSHAFLPNGNVIFLLSEHGEPKETEAGAGYDTSFYADCFVVMGFAEYARVMGDIQALEAADALFVRVRRRIDEGTARSEPYPIPRGYTAHGFPMILLNTSQVLSRAFLQLTGEARYESVGDWYARLILDKFSDSRLRLREVISGDWSSLLPNSAPESSEGQKESPELLLLRHLNPGHAIESLWFVMEQLTHMGPLDQLAEQKGNERTFLLEKAAAMLLHALELGWDQQHGGLLRYVDLHGGEPSGTRMPGGDRFERLISETWNMKLWWPHSEALYACLLAEEWRGDGIFQAWYERIESYTFRTFPARSGMEWIQIRDRQGNPLNRVAALPVKDPYHIMRNVMLIIERLSRHKSTGKKT